MNILIIHGPNLNLLGIREPDKYGKQTLEEINNTLYLLASKASIKLSTFQSNCEGQIINRIHEALFEGVGGVVANLGGYTHTSVAIRDAFLATNIPFIEAHMTNPHDREDFRKQSLFSDIAIDTIVGLGAHSYTTALERLTKHLGQ